MALTEVETRVCVCVRIHTQEHPCLWSVQTIWWMWAGVEWVTLGVEARPGRRAPITFLTPSSLGQPRGSPWYLSWEILGPRFVYPWMWNSLYRQVCRECVLT